MAETNWAKEIDIKSDERWQRLYTKSLDYLEKVLDQNFSSDSGAVKFAIFVIEKITGKAEQPIKHRGDEEHPVSVNVYLPKLNDNPYQNQTINNNLPEAPAGTTGDVSSAE